MKFPTGAKLGNYEIKQSIQNEDNLDERLPEWRIISMENDLNGRRPQRNITSKEDELNERRRQ